MSSASLDQQWLAFYQHQGSDHQERTIEDIWTMMFSELESHHDYIQWLFPLYEPSSVNPSAPLLSSQLINQMFDSPAMQENLLSSFDTMAAFLGFTRTSDNSIERSDQFDIQSRKWCCAANHNQLRITRILKSLTAFGYGELANNLCEFLLLEIDHKGISLSDIPAVSFWIEAVNTVENIELTEDDFLEQEAPTEEMLN